MKIIDRVFQVMESKNIKNIELANELKINKSVVSSWKSRNTNPPAEMIEDIAKFLNVSPTYILTGKEVLSDLSDEEINLIKKYNMLSEKNKGKTENFIDERLAEQEKEHNTNNQDLA